VDTLAGLLSGLAAEHGARVALVEGDRALTFDELTAAAAALAGDLAGWGVARGDVVALWLPNVLEYLVAEFALGALGAAALGINTRYGEHELAHLVERARPVGVVVPHRFLDIDFVGKLPRSDAWVGVVGASEGADLAGFDVGGGVHRLPDPTACDPAPLPRAGGQRTRSRTSPRRVRPAPPSSPGTRRRPSSSTR